MVAALLITNAPRDRSNWTTEAVPVFMPTAEEGNRGVNNLSSGFGISTDYFPFIILTAEENDKRQRANDW
jgi:hypothetical protein